MCEERKTLREKITHYRKFPNTFDPLTDERFKQVVADLERRKEN